MKIPIFAALAFCVISGLAPALGADAERGRALYEARCDLCHRTSVHVREMRKASTFEGLRAQVARWNTELGGSWSRDEVDDVTVYLNRRFYLLPCPESACGAGQAGAGTRRATALVKQ